MSNIEHLPMTGKTALVGGSTQGIGWACAQKLAHMGASVVLVARNAERLAQAAVQLATPAHQQHRIIVADFTHVQAVRAAVAEHIATHGAIHILVNNTGGPPGGPITQATDDHFLQAYESHLLVNHALVQLCLPGMKAAGYGRIVNIVSTSVREPIKGLGVSNTTRAAVAGWAKTLSTEVAAFGITVNNILPGATATARLTSIINNKAQQTGKTIQEIESQMLAEIPAARFAQPEEVAAAACFLCGPDAGYITGVSLPVDGGRMHCI